MTLSYSLAISSTPVARFFEMHCNREATARFLAKQVLDEAENEGDALVEMAFLYALRWRHEMIHPQTTFAYVGAKLLGQEGEFSDLVWRGNFEPDKRSDICITLSRYEMYARTGNLHDDYPPDVLDKWLDKLPDRMTNYLHRYVHAPTFSGSARVGGAHASMMLDSTLIEVCGCHDALDHDTFVKGIAHLVLDFQNELGVNNLAFYFPHNGQVLLFPIPTIVRNIGLLRERFQAQVPKQSPRRFDRHCTEYVGFQNYDFDGNE